MKTNLQRIKNWVDTIAGKGAAGIAAISAATANAAASLNVVNLFFGYRHCFRFDVSLYDLNVLLSGLNVVFRFEYLTVPSCCSRSYMYEYVQSPAVHYSILS